MLTINKSTTTSFGKITSIIFDDYPLYKCKISSELIDNYLPDRLKSFDLISWKNTAKRDFFYSKPIIFASRSQLNQNFEELNSLITFENLLNELLSENNSILRYNFVITGDYIIFGKLPHTCHVSYHLLCKHITLANRSEDVRFAGELWKNEKNSFMLNNNSGTYRPSNILIDKTVQLFNQLITNVQFQGISYQTNPRPTFKHRLIFKIRNKFIQK